MNITEHSTICKSASTKSVNSINTDNDNVILHWRYRKILTTGCKAYIMVISPKNITDELIQKYIKEQGESLFQLASFKLTLHYNPQPRVNGCSVGVSI